MNDNELKAVVRKALDQSLTVSSELESDQGDALDFYYGRAYGNEQAGRSQVVTREVLEAIEWIMPSLMRVFASGNKTVQFDPVGMDDEDSAELETKVVNHVFNKDNNGFEILHNWFKDALLQKVGYVKVFWEEEEEVVTESYSGLTDEALAELLEEGVEPIEHSQIEDVTVDEMGQQVFTVYHDVKIRRVDKSGNLKIINIPQEEMRVSKNATSISLDNVDFVAHCTEKTASDLLEMGYPKSLIEQLGSEDEEGGLQNYREVYSENVDGENDQSMRLITVNEAFIRTDYDGDGIAELRRVVMSGNHILENDEWDIIPFAALTPIMMPHKHIGLSEADLVMDIQQIKSTLVRQMLDNLYLTNNPEKEVLASQVNLDDLLKSLPGGIKRVKQMGSIREIAVPFTAGASQPMLDLLDGMKEARTGVSRHTMGLDADTLAQSTKGAFQTGLRQANQRLEMLARVFAETGVKALFLKIHALLIKHQDKARELKIDSDWVQIDPTEWRERKSMSVVVGIGTGDKTESLMNLNQLREIQEQHLLQGSPMVSMKNLYNTYEKMIELSELKDAERYFNDPDKLPPPEPKEPSTEEKMAQAQIEIAKLQTQNEMLRQQNESKKLEISAWSENEKRKDFEREFVYKEQELALKAQEVEYKYQIELAKLNKTDTKGQEAIEAAKIKANAEIEKARIDAEAKVIEIQNQREIAENSKPVINVGGGKKRISVVRTATGLEGMSETVEE